MECPVCKKATPSKSWSPSQWTRSSACIMVNGWWRNCCKDCSTVPGWYHNDAGPKCQSVAAVEDSITSHVYSLSLSSRPPPMEVEPPPPLEPRLQPSWGRPPIPCTNAGVQHTPWSPPVMESEPPPPMKPWQQPSWGPPPISCSKAEMQQHAQGSPPMEGEPSSEASPEDERERLSAALKIAKEDILRCEAIRDSLAAALELLELVRLLDPPAVSASSAGLSQLKALDNNVLWPQPSWGSPPMEGGPPPPREQWPQPSWGPPPMEAEPHLCRR